MTKQNLLETDNIIDKLTLKIILNNKDKQLKYIVKLIKEHKIKELKFLMPIILDYNNIEYTKILYLYDYLYNEEEFFSQLKKVSLDYYEEELVETPWIQGDIMDSVLYRYENPTIFELPEQNFDPSAYIIYYCQK